MVLGLLIALLPVLGFRTEWEKFFQVAAGLSIVAIIVWANVDKRLSLKAKAQKRQAQKVREAELNVSPNPNPNGGMPPENI